MRKLRMSLAALAVVAAIGCAPAPAEEPVMMVGDAADEAALEAVIQNVAAAWNAADAMAMTAMIAEDYEGISAEGTRTTGRAAYETMITEEFAAERPEGFMLSLDTGYIQWHSHDLATVAGTFVVAGLPEGAPNTGSWMVNMRRTDMGWLMTNALTAQFTPEPMEGGR